MKRLLPILVIITWIFVVFSIQGPEEPQKNLAAINIVEEVLAKERQNRKQILYLARCMISESDRIEEQRRVGWVIRNRVREAYRGQSTYKGVVLDPYQFSAFNHDSDKRGYYLSLQYNTDNDYWQETLALAEDIYFAPAWKNPHPGVLHFYSPVSMIPKYSEPDWARGYKPTLVIGNRFKFYSEVNEENV